MAQLSSAIHGTSFHVEDPSRADLVRPYGSGLAITGFRHGGFPGPALWVHAAIPTVAIWQLAPFALGGAATLVELDRTVTLTEVFVQFDASASPEFHVANLHVWDADRRIAQLDGLSERGSGFRHSFDPVLPITGAAINLSIGLEQPVIFDVVGGRPPAPTFVFNQATANFVVEGV